MTSKMRVVIDHKVPCSKIRVHIQSMSYLSLKKVTDTCDAAKLIQSFNRECKLSGQHILSSLSFNALTNAPARFSVRICHSRLQSLLGNPALGTLGSKMLQQQMENCKYKLQKNKVQFHLQNEEQDPENVCVKSSRMSTHLA